MTKKRTTKKRTTTKQSAKKRTTKKRSTKYLPTKPGPMKAYATFDLYLADQLPKNQAVIHALRKLVKRTVPALDESVKWGNGCWVAGKDPVAYVYSAPDHVQFGFFRGAFLDDPLGLLEGKGAYVRHIKMRKVADIDQTAFGALSRQASR